MVGVFPIDDAADKSPGKWSKLKRIKPTLDTFIALVPLCNSKKKDESKTDEAESRTTITG